MSGQIHADENTSPHIPNAVTSTSGGGKRALDVNILNPAGGTDDINLAQVGGLDTSVGRGPVADSVQRVTSAGGVPQGTNASTTAALNVPTTTTDIFTVTGVRKNNILFSNLDPTNKGEIRIGAGGNWLGMSANGGGVSVGADIPVTTKIQCRAQTGTLSEVVIIVT